jgi:Tol biopolymer transport system component
MFSRASAPEDDLRFVSRDCLSEIRNQHRCNGRWKDGSGCPNARKDFYPFNIWRMDAEGTQATQLTQGGMQTLPEVTADGEWVIYTENLLVDPRVWKIAAAGGQPQRLTSSLTSHPVGSPDGKQVAYVYLDDEEWGIAVRPLSGEVEQPRKYPFPATVASRVFRWSPDGQSLAYIAAENGASNLWLQPLDGGPGKRLTNFKSGELMSFA